MPLALPLFTGSAACSQTTTYQISSAAQFSVQQEDLKDKQIEDEQVSKETKLV